MARINPIQPNPKNRSEFGPLKPEGHPPKDFKNFISSTTDATGKEDAQISGDKEGKSSPLSSYKEGKAKSPLKEKTSSESESKFEGLRKSEESEFKSLHLTEEQAEKLSELNPIEAFESDDSFQERFKEQQRVFAKESTEKKDLLSALESVKPEGKFKDLDFVNSRTASKEPLFVELTPEQAKLLNSLGVTDLAKVETTDPRLLQKLKELMSQSDVKQLEKTQIFAPLIPLRDQIAAMASKSAEPPSSVYIQFTPEQAKLLQSFNARDFEKNQKPEELKKVFQELEGVLSQFKDMENIPHGEIESAREGRGLKKSAEAPKTFQEEFAISKPRAQSGRIEKEFQPSAAVQEKMETKVTGEKESPILTSIKETKSKPASDVTYIELTAEQAEKIAQLSPLDTISNDSEAQDRLKELDRLYSQGTLTRKDVLDVLRGALPEGTFENLNFQSQPTVAKGPVFVELTPEQATRLNSLGVTDLAKVETADPSRIQELKNLIGQAVVKQPQVAYPIGNLNEQLQEVAPKEVGGIAQNVYLKLSPEQAEALQSFSLANFQANPDPQKQEKLFDKFEGVLAQLGKIPEEGIKPARGGVTYIELTAEQAEKISQLNPLESISNDSEAQSRLKELDQLYSQGNLTRKDVLDTLKMALPEGTFANLDFQSSQTATKGPIFVELTPEQATALNSLGVTDLAKVETTDPKFLQELKNLISPAPVKQAALPFPLGSLNEQLKEVAPKTGEIAPPSPAPVYLQLTPRQAQEIQTFDLADFQKNPDSQKLEKLTQEFQSVFSQLGGESKQVTFGRENNVVDALKAAFPLGTFENLNFQSGQVATTERIFVELSPEQTALLNALGMTDASKVVTADPKVVQDLQNIVRQSPVKQQAGDFSVGSIKDQLQEVTSKSQGTTPSLPGSAVYLEITPKQAQALQSFSLGDFQKNPDPQKFDKLAQEFQGVLSQISGKTAEAPSRGETLSKSSPLEAAVTTKINVLESLKTALPQGTFESINFQRNENLVKGPIYVELSPAQATQLNALQTTDLNKGHSNDPKPFLELKNIINSANVKQPDVRLESTDVLGSIPEQLQSAVLKGRGGEPASPPSIYLQMTPEQAQSLQSFNLADFEKNPDPQKFKKLSQELASVFSQLSGGETGSDLSTVSQGKTQTIESQQSFRVQEGPDGAPLGDRWVEGRPVGRPTLEGRSTEGRKAEGAKAPEGRIGEGESERGEVKPVKVSRFERPEIQGRFADLNKTAGPTEFRSSAQQVEGNQVQRPSSEDRFEGRTIERPSKDVEAPRREMRRGETTSDVIEEVQRKEDVVPGKTISEDKSYEFNDVRGVQQAPKPVEELASRGHASGHATPEESKRSRKGIAGEEAITPEVEAAAAASVIQQPAQVQAPTPLEEIEAKPVSREEMVRMIEELVDQIKVIKAQGQTDTVVELKSPKFLEGASITLITYDQARGEANIVFSNLTPQAKQILDDRLAKDSLTSKLKDRADMVVHNIITTTQAEPPVFSRPEAERNEDRRDREQGEGGGREGNR